MRKRPWIDEDSVDSWYDINRGSRKFFITTKIEGIMRSGKKSLSMGRWGNHSLWLVTLKMFSFRNFIRGRGGQVNSSFIFCLIICTKTECFRSASRWLLIHEGRCSQRLWNNTRDFLLKSEWICSMVMDVVFIRLNKKFRESTRAREMFWCIHTYMRPLESAPRSEVQRRRERNVYVQM